VDFITENGLWKFWHFHIYRIFRCGWDDKWADQFASTYAPVVPIDYTDETKPDGPPVDSQPYDVKAVTRNIPAPPQPYETWDDSTTYGFAGGVEGQTLTLSSYWYLKKLPSSAMVLPLLPR
jgi:hypothetical protein